MDMSGSVMADIVEIHHSKRSEAQQDLINCAARCAYDIGEPKGWVILTWNNENDLMKWNMDEGQEGYVLEAVAEWFKDE